MMQLQSYGSKAIVYACGPTALLEECANLTMEFGVDIRTEGFQL
jgi:NAD(P)H-flavin reductase